jgi:S-DNA-T family DNA segregation ATPase FtsK/SpoIIIE
VTAAHFPVIGVVAPMAVAGLVWGVTGSTFALLGAVIAPTMVIAHHIDGVRRAARETRRAESVRANERAAEREANEIRAAQRIVDENRKHPSVADIARNPEWVPARDGVTVVRAGHQPDGSPWLVDVAAGVAVIGDGPVADAVWRSLVVQATAGLGVPRDSGETVRWANGASIVRGETTEVGIVTRCSAQGVDSVTTRGSLPARVDYLPDDTSGADVILDTIARTRRERLRVSLTSDTPHVLIAGRTGSGKSHALTALVVEWTTRFTSAEFQFVGIDFKGGATLGPLCGLPHHLATLTDLTTTDVPRAIAGLSAEIPRREAEFVRQRVASIENSIGVPRLAIVIDEVHEFLRQFPRAHDLLADIARRGRSLGVHLVLAVQHPSGVLRDAVLANIPVRICLAMNTLHDVVQVLGRTSSIAPTRGSALVTVGDGLIHEVRVQVVDVAALGVRPDDPPSEPPWKPALTAPVPREGRTGFGLVDDVVNACYRIAHWQPSDGDVAVIGDRGSGRTETLRALVDGHTAMWVTSASELNPHPEARILVIDDLDRIVDSMAPLEAATFLESIRRVRQSSSPIAVVVSSDQPLPRAFGPVRTVITLRTATLDAHRATGAPPETFDPAAAPGSGTWRGLRFVLYARTDSSDTASRP